MLCDPDKIVCEKLTLSNTMPNNMQSGWGRAQIYKDYHLPICYQTLVGIKKNYLSCLVW